jgi:hypothetical protein
MYSACNDRNLKLWILSVLVEHPRDASASGILANALMDPAIGDIAAYLISDTLEVLSRLIGKLARNARESWRRRLCEVLARSDGHFCAAEIAETLTSRDAHYCADILGSMSAEVSIPHLVAALDHHGAAPHCARVLGAMGDQAGYDILARIIDRGLICPEVVTGLGLTRDKRAGVLLRKLLSDPAYGAAAQKGLVHLGERRDLPLFISLLGIDGRIETGLLGIKAVGNHKELPVVELFMKNYRFTRSDRGERIMRLAEEVHGILQMR